MSADRLADSYFARARDLMVDGQLRPNKVTDPRILGAMRTLPRETFLPPAAAQLAYIDGDVELGHGRACLKPLVLARLIQLAAPVRGETALVVGAGTGYSAAILAACGAQVFALEEEASLIELGSAAWPPGGVPVTWQHGRLADGWPGAAPYDIVFIEGAVRAIPETLARQVAATGRLVAILSPPGGASYAVLAEPSAGGLALRPAFDAAAPLLKSLLPSPSFAF